MNKKYKEYVKILIFYIILLIICLYKLPYVIYTGGTIQNIDKKISIENSYKKEGSFNILAVKSRDCNIFLYLYGLINKNTELVKTSELKYNENETLEDISYRDKLDLEIANNNAILNAYKLLNKNIEITNEEFIVYFIDSMSDTNLKIKDKVISYDNIKYQDLDSFKSYIQTKNINDKITLKVERNNKIIECYGTVKEIENNKVIGIGIIKNYNLKVEPEVSIKFKKNESGPSAGLMVALEIYNDLIEEDITKGKKIAGTGTIDELGNIGPVGGIKYKLQGAVKKKADYIIVSNIDNYDECDKLIKKHNYKIKLIGVDTLEDAINKLKEI